MRMRNATKDDCPKCKVIGWEGGLMTPDYGGIPLEYYHDYVGDALFFVAEDKGEILGFALGQTMRASYAELILLSVDLNHRRKGIGTKLVQEFRKRCKDIDIEHISILAPLNDLSEKFWRSQGIKGGQRYAQLCFTPEEYDSKLPLTIEGRWDLLYSRHPEKYDEFCNYESTQDENIKMHNMFDFEDKEVVDIGSGTGESTFYFAKYAKSVIGVEPEKAMNDEALRKAKEQGIENVSFVEGTAQKIPLPDNSADVVTGMYFVDYPAHITVPAFIEEATRVLRDGGLILVANDPPNAYGGEMDRIIKDSWDGAEERHRQYMLAGFDYHDTTSLKHYGSVENAVSGFGFIFGMNAINYIREHGKTRLIGYSRRHFKEVKKSS